MNDEYNAGLGTTPGMWEMVSETLEDEQLPVPITKALHMLLSGEAKLVPKNPHFVELTTKELESILVQLNDSYLGEAQTCLAPSLVAKVVEVLGKGNPLTGQVCVQDIIAEITQNVEGFGNCPDCAWARGSGCNTTRDSRTCKLNKKPCYK